MLPKSNLVKVTNGMLVNLALIESIAFKVNDEGHTQVSFKTLAWIKLAELVKQNHFQLTFNETLLNVSEEQLTTEILEQGKLGGNVANIFIPVESTNQEHKLINFDSVVAITATPFNDILITYMHNSRLTYILPEGEERTAIAVVNDLHTAYLEQAYPSSVSAIEIPELTSPTSLKDEKPTRKGNN